MAKLTVSVLSVGLNGECSDIVMGTFLCEVGQHFGDPNSMNKIPIQL